MCCCMHLPLLPAPPTSYVLLKGPSSPPAPSPLPPPPKPPDVQLHAPLPPRPPTHLPMCCCTLLKCTLRTSVCQCLKLLLM